MKQLLALSLVCAATGAYAMNGQQLLAGLAVFDGPPPNTIEAATKLMGSISYIVGAVEAFNYSGKLCTGAGENTAQWFAIIKKYLNANPERWQERGEQIVYEALSPTFSCKRAK